MLLQNTLVKVPQREFSGSSSDRKFDFQKDWAIYQSLLLHEKGQEFAMCLEFHDDVIILDSIENPSNVTFCQVKTRNEPLTIGFLTRKGKNIIQKLVQNMLNFEGKTLALKIITNTTFKFNATIKKQKIEKIFDYEYCCKEIDKAFIDVIREKLIRDIDSKYDLPKLNFEDYLYFTPVPLHEKSSSETIVGEINRFLHNKGCQFGARNLYSALFMEYKRKTQKDPRPIKSYKDLLGSKTITSKYFSKMIDNVLYNGGKGLIIKKRVNKWIDDYYDDNIKYSLKLKQAYSFFLANRQANQILNIEGNINNLFDEVNLDGDIKKVVNDVFKVYSNNHRNSKNEEAKINVIFLHKLAEKMNEYE